MCYSLFFIMGLRITWSSRIRVPISFFSFWAYSHITPASAFRNYYWHGSGDHLGCQELNKGWTHTRQVLYYLSSPKILIYSYQSQLTQNYFDFLWKIQVSPTLELLITELLNFLPLCCTYQLLLAAITSIFTNQMLVKFHQQISATKFCYYQHFPCVSQLHSVAMPPPIYPFPT